MNKEYETAFGQNLRLIRIKKEMSQEQVAARLQVMGCDITRSALAKIEVGQRHVYPDEIRLLHLIFEVPYEALFLLYTLAMRTWALALGSLHAALFFARVFS